MQFNRDASGKLTPLPKPCVDTGLGLERVAAVLQVVSNYDTDFFTPLIDRAAQLTGVDEKKELAAEEHRRPAASLRVIADHARATTFLINDGVLPSNEARLRPAKDNAAGNSPRSCSGSKRTLFTEMVPAVSMLMSSTYPELGQSTPRIQRIVLSEEERFARVLGSGFARLDSLLDQEFAEYIKGLLLESAFENRFDLYDELRRRADEIPWFAYSRLYRAEVGPLRDALGNAFGPGRAEALLHDVVQKTSQKPYVLPGEPSGCTKRMDCHSISYKKPREIYILVLIWTAMKRPGKLSGCGRGHRGRARTKKRRIRRMRSWRRLSRRKLDFYHGTSGPRIAALRRSSFLAAPTAPTRRAARWLN